MSKIRKYEPGEMLTYTGEVMNVLDPKPEKIQVVDIAHHLSQLCRWTGATSVFYSVAEHSVHCLRLAQRLVEGQEFTVGNDILCRVLLHDAAEAYLGDVGAPLKQFLQNYRRIEVLMELAIKEAPELKGCYANGDRCFKPMLAHEVDLAMLYVESCWFMDSPIIPGELSLDLLHLAAEYRDSAHNLAGVGRSWTSRSAEQHFLDAFVELAAQDLGPDPDLDLED